MCVINGSHVTSHRDAPMKNFLKFCDWPNKGTMGVDRCRLTWNQDYILERAMWQKFHNTRDTGERFYSCNSFRDAGMSYLIVNGWEKAARSEVTKWRFVAEDLSGAFWQQASSSSRLWLSPSKITPTSASLCLGTGEGRKRASGKTTAVSYTRFEAQRTK